MRFVGRSGSSGAARVRRAAFALLLLTLHAVLAGAMHFPRPAQTPTAQSGRAPSFVVSWEAVAPAESGAHSQCLLCRLQRNLSTGLKNSAPVAFSPPHDSPPTESDPTGNLRTTTPGITVGRAPPRP